MSRHTYDINPLAKQKRQVADSRLKIYFPENSVEITLKTSFQYWIFISNVISDDIHVIYLKYYSFILLMADSSLLKQVFTNIYAQNNWQMGQGESKSGIGSTLNYTQSIRENILRVIQQYDIHTMIDTSCGDWNWMQTIKENLCDYTGIDIVEDVIEANKKQFSNNKTRFICCDFVSYLKTLPSQSVDLILCRHTCEHLPTTYILDFIQECKRVSKYLLLTTKKTSVSEKCNQELVINHAPYRPINLDQQPFQSLLHSFFVEELYDGPSLRFDPEMYIYLYKFY